MPGGFLPAFLAILARRDRLPRPHLPPAYCFDEFPDDMEPPPMPGQGDGDPLTGQAWPLIGPYEDSIELCRRPRVRCRPT